MRMLWFTSMLVASIFSKFGFFLSSGGYLETLKADDSESVAHRSHMEYGLCL